MAAFLINSTFYLVSVLIFLIIQPCKQSKKVSLNTMTFDNKQKRGYTDYYDYQKLKQLMVKMVLKTAIYFEEIALA